MCDAGHDCTKSYSNPQMDGALVGSSLGYPGISFCEDSIGCENNGCWSCAPACTYSRWSIRPVPSTFPVYKVASYKRVTKIRICTGGEPASGTSNLCEAFTVSEGIPRTGGFKVSVQEISENLSYSTDGMMIAGCSIGQQRCGKMIRAAERNTPRAGMVGDVQGASYGSFSTPSANSFIFDPTICSSVMSGYHNRFICQISGARTVVEFPYFPVSIGSVVWEMTPSGMVGIDSNPEAVLVDIQTLGALKVQQTLDKVCPVAKVDHISGCYSCDEGFVIHLVARSDCLPGVVSILSGPELVILEGSVLLERHDKHFTVKALSSNEFVKSFLTFTSFTDVLNISVAGRLTSPAVHLFNRDTHQYENSTNLVDKIHFWSWSKKLGLIAGMIVAGIVMFCICSLLCWCTCSAGSSMVWSRMVKTGGGTYEAEDQSMEEWGGEAEVSEPESVFEGLTESEKRDLSIKMAQDEMLARLNARR